MSMRLKRQAPYGSTARRLGTLASVLTFFLLGLAMLVTDQRLFSSKTLSKSTPPAILVAQAPELSVRAPAVSVAAPQTHKRPVQRSTAKNFRSMTLNRSVNLRHYTYRFEGRATYKGEPCAQASVLVRLSSSQGTKTTGGLTNPDGSYAVEVGIEAAADEPVDWTVEAFTRDFHKVQMDGRRIVTKEDGLITVQKPLEFASARLP